MNEVLEKLGEAQKICEELQKELTESDRNPVLIANEILTLDRLRHDIAQVEMEYTDKV